MKKVTWNDIHEATPKELKKTYKLSDRQLEMNVRNHLDGSNAKDRRMVYKQLFERRK